MLTEKVFPRQAEVLTVAQWADRLKAACPCGLLRAACGAWSSGARNRPVSAGTCPFTVDRPVMRQRWERLTFLHWQFDPAAVQRLLPGRLEVDDLRRSGLGRARAVLHARGHARRHAACRGCRTSARRTCAPTSATGRDEPASGSSPWMPRASAPSPWPARPTGCPTSGRRCGCSSGHDQIAYACRRRWPGPRGAASPVRLSIGEPYAAAELGDLDHFLTARWILFSVRGSRHRFARACHQPWPLHRAEVTGLDDQLDYRGRPAAAGGEPLVHYSPGVDVRIGRPEKVCLENSVRM